jgi:predicted nuclease of predicted toxin-antitoxin system
VKLLADEGVDRAIVERLRRDGHSVVYVAEGAPGITDEAVLAAANASGAILLTADKDFGELVFRCRRAHPGIVLVRLMGMPAADKADVVSLALEAHGEEMLGVFTVITDRAIRIRK